MARQKAQRRELILSAARDLITERGYREVTMRAIAERCGVSIPTLYNLCGDRQALLFEAVSSHLSGVLLDTSVVSTKRGHEKVVAIAEAISAEMCRMPEYHRTMMGVLAGSDSAHELSAGLSRLLAAEFEHALDEMKASGHLAPWADPGPLARSVAGQVVIVSAEWASGTLPDSRLRAAMVFGVSLVLLGVAEGKAAAALRRHAKACQAAALPDPAPSVPDEAARTA